tara:strand:- start:3413 stop:3928 length:516 start_codon:yes stop_codon:yes gene_type:complete
MGKFNSHFSDYYSLRTIIEHLDQIVEIMEKKYGIDQTYLKYVDKGLREKFLKQEERLIRAIKREDNKNIIELARGMIKAFKIVDGICEDQQVKKIDSNVWQTKHDGLPKTIVNVSRYNKQLPLGQHEGQVWISLEGLVNTIPRTVFATLKEFKGARVKDDVDNFYDDPIPF